MRRFWTDGRPSGSHPETGFEEMNGDVACRAAFTLVGTIEQHDLAISGQQLQRDGPPSLVDFAL